MTGYRARQYQPKPQRTQAEKKLEAINFVWCAMERVIRDQSVTGASIAQMKGVVSLEDVADIEDALERRRAGVPA